MSIVSTTEASRELHRDASVVETMDMGLLVKGIWKRVG